MYPPMLRFITMQTTIMLVVIISVIIGILLFMLMNKRKPSGIVVSDTSPISSLATVGQLDLLNQLYGKVWITPEVWNEIAEKPANKALVEQASWIIIREVQDRAKIHQLVTIPRGHNKKPLDIGEATAIALAIECSAKLLVIDEKRGRIAAEYEGIEIVGVLTIVASSL